MIGTIRRHQTWLWGIIIGATILTFVYYLGPTQRYGGGGGGPSPGEPDLGSIDGEPVSVQEYNAARREGRLAFFMHSGAWPETEDQKNQVDRMAEQLLFINSLIKQYKINVTDDAAARFTKQMFGLPPNQPFPRDKFEQWARDVLMLKGQLTLDDFDRFVRHQAAQQYLVALFGMSGKLITPQEAEFFYRRETEPMVTQIVTFPATNYYAATKPTEAELEDFFAKHQADYRLPDRVQVNYVAFPISNYLAQADKTLGTNMDDRVDQFYREQDPNQFKDAAGKIMTAAEAKDRIKKGLRENQARIEAAKDANALLTDLTEGHDAAHPYSPGDLFKVAKAKGLTVKTTEPFDEKSGCKDLDLAPKALHVLFSLRESDPDDPDRSSLYASSPLPGESALYIVGLQKFMPSQAQPLAAVRSQVEHDYRDIKALALAKDAGEKFAEALKLGATEGKSFDALCAAQNLKPQSLPPFSLTTTNVPPSIDKDDFRALEETAYSVPTGEFSRFVPMPDGGFVVYVQNRLPVDPATLRQQLPSYLAKMREQRQFVAFQEWLGRQMQMRLVPPVNQRTSAGAG